jgi:hypothetical protein
LSLAQSTTTSPITPGTNVSVAVTGTVLNTMVGNQIDIGPDPLTGQSEVVTVKAVSCTFPPPPNPPFPPNPRFNPVITADFTKSYSPGTPITFRGNPGPWPRTMNSVLASPVAAGNNAMQVTGALQNIPGTVSNIMVNTLITIGPDPNSGNTEQVGVIAVDTTNAANPTIWTTPFTRPYTANTPITWRSNVQFQPRNDPGVVLHMSVVQ